MRSTLGAEGAKTQNIPVKRYCTYQEWKNQSANIGMAYEESIACIMTQKPYLENLRMEWAPVNKKII